MTGLTKPEKEELKTRIKERWTHSLLYDIIDALPEKVEPDLEEKDWVCDLC